ncbi:MAG TPA: GntR family transcriptional regulator [Anaeromyxobacter sp.]|nr:GntR family transcriptional regulator [Anaeromyxobacter sp.]
MGSTSKRPALRSVLGDQVKDHLLQAILTGRYAPGARIVETQVARELGVSQSPVREALRDLAALGVVEMPAFRGARVRRPTADELLDAFVVRAELEVLAVRLALPRLTDGELDRLAGLIEQMQKGAREGDLHAEAIADAAFHSRIVELTGNAVLQRVWRTTEPFSRTYITIVVRRDDPYQIVDLHWPVLEALRSRDPERAASAIRTHFEEAAGMVGRLWSKEEISPAERAPATILPGRLARDGSG